MNLKDRLKQYKQEREAKNYFRAHNSYRLTGKDYVKLIAVGLIVGLITGGLLAFVELHIAISFSFIYLIVGYIMAEAIKKATGKTGVHVGRAAAVMTLVAFYLKEVVSILMMYSSLQMDMTILKVLSLAFGGLISSGLISWLFVLAGMYVAYNRCL